MTVDHGGHLLLSPLLRTAARWAPKLQVHQKNIRTTGTNDGYLLSTPYTCCDHYWSDEHESITVRSDEAAFPVDVGGSMIGSVKKEPSSLRTTVSLGVRLEVLAVLERIEKLFIHSFRTFCN